jgi:hypothetical protein
MTRGSTELRRIMFESAPHLCYDGPIGLLELRYDTTK